MSIDQASRHIDPNWWKTKSTSRKLLSAAYRPGACVDLLKESVDNCRTYGTRVRSGYGLRDLASDLYGQLVIAWSYGLDPEDWFSYRYWETDWQDVSTYSDITLVQGWLNETSAAPTHLSVCTGKIAFYRFCGAHEIPTIPVIGYAADGEYAQLSRGRNEDPPRHALIVKPAAANRGDDIHVFSFDDGTYVDDDGAAWTWEALTEDLARTSKRSDDALIVQPLVRNDSSWQRFTSGGLATVRLLTGRFPGGQVECLRASLRMPVGDSRIDNFSRGNLASAVDLDTGQLGPAVSKYPLPIGHSFPKHPDTETRIAGVPLSEWPSVRESALRLHERLKIPVLGLDVALTPRGVRVVEANPFYGRSSLEIPHGTSLSTTRFADVVRAWISAPDGESKSAARMPQHQSTMDTATSIP